MKPNGINTLLPQNINAEKGLIGSMLLDQTVVNNCATLEEGAFHLPVHALLFRVLLGMREKRIPMDLITVQDAVDRTLIAAGGRIDGLDSASVALALTEAFVYVPTAGSWKYYWQMVSEAHVRRKVIAAATRCAKLAREHHGSADDLMIDVEKECATMRDGFRPPSQDMDRSLLMEYVDSIELLATGNGQSSLRSTPLQTVNDKSGGTGDGEVTIITGPPSSGKSILGKQFALHYIQEHKFPALIFTAEMPYQQWMNRAVCEIGQIPFKSFREGRLNANEMTSLSTTIARLSKMPLQVYDRKRIKFTKNALESVIRHEAKTSGAKFILLDYLQKVSTERKKDQRTDEAIGEVSDMLKDVAVQFGLHVFILASENDDGSVRSSREPEYDADNILKLMVKTEKNERTGNPMIITDKIICKKWRDAERGYTVRVEMEGKYCRFRDITGANA